MCRLSSLLVLFLVGVARRETVHAGKYENNKGLSPIDLGLKPDKFDEIKTIVANVLKNYISPSNDLITQKNSRQLFPSNLNATLISDCISGEVEKLVVDLGLKNTEAENKGTSLRRVGQFDVGAPKTVRESIIHEVFEFVHKLIPIGQGITSVIQNHLQENDYQAKGYPSAQLSFGEHSMRNSPHILKLVTYTANAQFSLNAYLQCLKTIVEPFHLANAFAKLVKYPPKVTRKIVTLRLAKPIPNNPKSRGGRVNDMMAMACRVLVEDPSNTEYKNCLEQVVMIERCVQDLFNEYVNGYKRQNSRSSSQLTTNMQTLNASCRPISEAMSETIICQGHRYGYGGIRLLPFTEKLLGKSFMRSPESQNVVKKLGNLITRSRVSFDIIQEVNNLVEIYREAVRKGQYLLKKSETDPRILQDYSKHSRHLAQYTKSLSNIAMEVIEHLRRITGTVEEAVIRTVSMALGINLSSNFRALRCFGKFWHNLKNWLEEHFSQSKPKPHAWQDFFGVNASSTKNDDQNLTGDDLQRIFDLSSVFNRDWFTSMRSIVRTNARRKSNTIMTLANTFLLATMFYECIVILAGAIYQTEKEEVTTTRPMNPGTVELPHGLSDYYGDYDNLDGIFRRE